MVMISNVPNQADFLALFVFDPFKRESYGHIEATFPNIICSFNPLNPERGMTPVFIKLVHFVRK
jgi:hypothetical protein